MCLWFHFQIGEKHLQRPSGFTALTGTKLHECRPQVVCRVDQESGERCPSLRVWSVGKLSGRKPKDRVIPSHPARLGGKALYLELNMREVDSRRYSLITILNLPILLIWLARVFKHSQLCRLLTKIGMLSITSPPSLLKVLWRLVWVITISLLTNAILALVLFKKKTQ